MSFKTIVILACAIGSVYMQSVQPVFDSKVDLLKAPAQQISIVNAQLLVIGQGPYPKVIFGIADIVTTLNKNTAQTDPKIRGLNNPSKICELMTILIGKAGILPSAPFVRQPVAAVLRQLEGSVDANVFKEIAKLAKESKAPASQALRQNLGKADACIKKAIQVYQG